MILGMNLLVLIINLHHTKNCCSKLCLGYVSYAVVMKIQEWVGPYESNQQSKVEFTTHEMKYLSVILLAVTLIFIYYKFVNLEQSMHFENIDWSSIYILEA